MFFVEDNNKIVLQDSDKERLEKTLAMCPQYSGLTIRETVKNIAYGYIEGSDEYQQVCDRVQRDSDVEKLRRDIISAILSDNESEISVLKSKYKALTK